MIRNLAQSLVKLQALYTERCVWDYAKRARHVRDIYPVQIDIIIYQPNHSASNAYCLHQRSEGGGGGPISSGPPLLGDLKRWKWEKENDGRKK